MSIERRQHEGYVSALTPELSRTDLRPWASETQWYLHEAAKRARLERIVRARGRWLLRTTFPRNALPGPGLQTRPCRLCCKESRRPTRTARDLALLRRASE